jgi:hypothetical protein
VAASTWHKQQIHFKIRETIFIEESLSAKVNTRSAGQKIYTAHETQRVNVQNALHSAKQHSYKTSILL